MGCSRCNCNFHWSCYCNDGLAVLISNLWCSQEKLMALRPSSSYFGGGIVWRLDDICSRYAIKSIFLDSICLIWRIEWFDGSPNLNGSEFSLLWIYLVFMNGLWVVIPALLVWDGMARISYVCAFFFCNPDCKCGPIRLVALRTKWWLPFRKAILLDLHRSFGFRRLRALLCSIWFWCPLFCLPLREYQFRCREPDNTATLSTCERACTRSWPSFCLKLVCSLN